MSDAKTFPVPTVLEADYVAEVRTPGGFPPIGAPEIGISGRSNVGKSTLLNKIAARRSLARTSKTPGRTRGVIFYDLKIRTVDGAGAGGAEGQPLRLADLPGYGYAQVSKTERVGWGPLIEGYVKTRRTLALVLVLVDARRGIDDEERQLLEWLETVGVPVQLVVTKVDKLSATERGLLRDKCKAAMGGRLPSFLAVSGQTGEGVDRLWNSILRAAERMNAAPAEAPEAP